MSFSTIGSYLQGGLSNAFQFLFFPFNMLRRFSYSFFTLVTTRFNQRGITDTTSKLSETSALLNKNARTNTTMASTLPNIPSEQLLPKNNDTIITVEEDNSIDIIDGATTTQDQDPEAAVIKSQATISSPQRERLSKSEETDEYFDQAAISHKRPSISDESEKDLLPAEKKLKLQAAEQELDLKNTETGTLTDSTLETLEGNKVIDKLDNSTSSEKFEPKLEVSALESFNFETPNTELEAPVQGVVSKKARRKPKSKPNTASFSTSTASTSNANEKQTNKNANHTTEKRPRMNYFVGIQVNSSEIRRQIKTLQDNMLTTLNKNPKIDNRGRRLDGHVFRDTMIPVARLHFTLVAIHLKDEDDIEKARRVLRNVWLKFKDDFLTNSMVLPIQGVGHFKDSVVFAKLNSEPCVQRLSLLAKELREEMAGEKIVTDMKEFTPHLTIAKISASDKLTRMNIWKIPREMWLASEAEYFGDQIAQELQLLSMREKDETGYYKLIAGFPLVGDSNSQESVS